MEHDFFHFDPDEEDPLDNADFDDGDEESGLPLVSPFLSDEAPEETFEETEEEPEEESEEEPEEESEEEPEEESEEEPEEESEEEPEEETEEETEEESEEESEEEPEEETEEESEEESEEEPEEEPEEETEEETEEEPEEEPEEKDKDEDKPAISSDLIRGHINTIILRSLYDGDKYGYEIIDEIERKSHGQYTLKQPSLYSALKRLEKDGYITSYWGGSVSGGRRKYFSLTDEGKEIAERNQTEWEYSRTVIDSLISDKAFDFAQPAPSSVDMRVLKQSTSRVPDRDREDDFRDEYDEAPENDDLAAQRAAFEEERARYEESLRVREEVLRAREEAGTKREQELLEREFALAEEERRREEEREAAQAEEAERETIAETAEHEDGEVLTEEVPALNERPEPEEPSEHAQDMLSETPEEEERRLQEEAERQQRLYEEEQERLLEEEQNRLAEAERQRQLSEEEERRKAAGETLFSLTEEERARAMSLSQEKEEQNARIREMEPFAEERARYEQRLRDQETEFREMHERELAEQEARIREEDERLYRHREQQIIHQNYLDLVNGGQSEAPTESSYYYEAPSDADNYVYVSKPEAEREYRSIILKLYNSALPQGAEIPQQAAPIPAVAPTPVPMPAPAPMPAPEPAPVPPMKATVAPQQEPVPTAPPAPPVPPREEPVGKAPRVRTGRSLDGVDFYDLESLAAQDGIRITTAGGRHKEMTEKSESLVHRGKALFLSALVVFLLCLAEGSIALGFQSQLKLPRFYPYFIWGTGLALFLVTGLLFLNRFGERSLRRTGNLLVNIIVAYALCIIVILIVALAAKIDFADMGQLTTYVILPAVYFFSIVVFGVAYYLQVRPLRDD